MIDAELGRRHREVEEAVLRACRARASRCSRCAREVGVRLRVLEGAGDVADAALEVLPERRVDGLAARERADALLHLGAERVVRLLAARDADHGEAARQRAADGEVVERRHQLAARQVAGRAEDDDSTSVARTIFDEPTTEGIRCLHVGLFSSRTKAVLGLFRSPPRAAPCARAREDTPLRGPRIAETRRARWDVGSESERGLFAPPSAGAAGARRSRGKIPRNCCGIAACAAWNRS